MMIEDINKVLINKNNNVNNQDIISFMKSLIASDIKLEENDRFSCISLGGLDEKLETIISFILKELNVDFNSTSDILSKNKNLSDIYVSLNPITAWHPVLKQLSFNASRLFPSTNLRLVISYPKDFKIEISSIVTAKKLALNSGILSLSSCFFFEP